MTDSEVKVYKVKTEGEARRKAKDLAKVPRESRGGVKIPASTLNKSSRGPKYYDMLAHKPHTGQEHSIGMRNPYSVNYYEIHPDNHLGTPGEHHNKYHVHGVTPNGQKFLVVVDGSDKKTTTKTSNPNNVKGFIKQEYKKKTTSNNYKIISPEKYGITNSHNNTFDIKSLKNPSSSSIALKDTKSFGSINDINDYFKKISNSIKNSTAHLDTIKQIGKGSMKLFNGLSIGLDCHNIYSAFSSGNYKQAASLATQMAFSYLGSFVGGLLTSEGGPTAFFGAMVGGKIGSSLGSNISKFLFGQCLTSAGLNEKNAKTGGVEVRNIASLSQLKGDIFFLFSQINLIAFPFNSEIPKIIEQLLPGVQIDFIVHRIIYELYYGIVVQEAPILFSLHFAKEGFLYPVIHPYYRNTLTGYILGLLDYFLKGFVNGGVYSPQFLLDWDKTKNMDSDYLRKNIIDIREELRKANLQSIGYLSLRELYNDEDEFTNGKQKYFSAFRILGKTNKVQMSGNYIIPDCDFDVEHDLNPSIEVISDLSKADSKDFQNSYKMKEEIYQMMHEQIHEKMPQVPMFAPWFELLKIISFGAHYVQTLIETGIQPCIPEPDLVKPFPTAMPPIPVRRAKTFNINLSFYDFIRQLSSNVIKQIDTHMYKIINDEVFDFILIENLLKEESRKIVKEKLLNYLPIQQVEHRDDSELQIEKISNIIKVQLQAILYLQSHELVNWYRSFDQMITKSKKLYENVLNDIDNLTFKQKLALIRQNLPSFIKNEMQEYMPKFDEMIRNLTNQQNIARQNINRNFSELNKAEKEAFNTLNSEVNQEQQKARNWRDEQNDAIDKQIQMYSNSQIDWSAVNHIRMNIQNEYSNRMEYIANYQRDKSNLINSEVSKQKKLIQQKSNENDEIFDKKKKEVMENKNKCESEFYKELKNVEDKFIEFENKKKIQLSSFLQLRKKELDDNMKKIILLDNVRLFFIDIDFESAWSQNIRGGCSVKSNIEPEVIRIPSFPFQINSYEDKNFEIRIQNYLISGILTEHRWYASPISFVNYNLEMKKKLNTINANIDNLGGKRMIDFVIETGNVDLLRNIFIQNINSPGIDGFSPLLTAVTLSNYEMVKVLLRDYKADYNYKHPNGLTPLLAATQSGNSEITLLLLDQPQIQMNVSLDNGMSPMHYAVLNSDINVIKRMTQLGVYADSEESIRNQDGCNAFLFAAKLGCVKELEVMAVKNKDCCSADGSNALHWAASSNSNSLKCTELLYNKFKVSPNKQNCRKQYPIHVAIEARNDDSAIYLYDISPQCASIKDDKNKTAKDLAITYGAVGFLAHAFPNQSILNNIIQKENRNIEEAIQDAIFRNNLPDTSRLIGELANQKVISTNLEKLIKSALIVGSEQLLDIVVRATPDIRLIKFSHQMVLSHLVVQSGQDKLISAVSKFGFTFDEKDDLNNTPIWYALMADDSKTIKQIFKCRENTDNLMSLFQNAAQKAFEDRKPKCIKSLMKYQKRIKKQIKINGTYLCNNLNVVSNDVNKAIQMGLEIKKSDVFMAASKSLPEVLSLIIPYFCKENVSLKTEIIKECVKISCKDVRLDNILAIRKLSGDKMNDYFDSLTNEMRYSKYSFWIIEALKGDPKNLIQSKIQEIRNLLKHGIDISSSNNSGIRKKMIGILEEFPLKNMIIEHGLPFLHYAIRYGAIWSFSCLPKDYDMSHKIGGYIAYDFLPFSYNMIKNQLILNSPENSQIWGSLNVNNILESLTFNFSDICVNLGCSNSFISFLCKIILNKSKSLKNPTLLHILIRSKASINDLEPIIKSRIDWCHEIDHNGWTPLMHAVCIQNYELAKLIIKNIPSENIEFRDYLGNNVLHLLIMSSDSENRDLSDFAIELISKCPQLIRMQNRNGETPCSLAATKGQIALLAAFGSFDSFDPESVIHSAAAGNQVNVIKFLMNSNCSSIRVDPNARLQHVTKKYQVLGDNFLHTAARYGSVDAFIELVKIGVNPLQTNNKNIMPIEIAFQIGNTKMIEFILCLPCILNASSIIKSIAITSCAKGSRKDIKCLDAMIKCGFPIESMDQFGNPLIHCAAISDNSDTIHLVLNSGADILAVSESKMTVLHLCSLLNKPNALRTLLDWASFCLSIDEYYDWIDAKNEEDNTALHVASEANNDICVSILLAYGADEQYLNSKKLTAAQLAVVSNSLNSLGVLKQIVNDTSFEAVYPLEYTDIVTKFKEKINKKEISIPELYDASMTDRLANFAQQVYERVLPLDQDIIEKMSDDDKKLYLNDDNKNIGANKQNEFNSTFCDKFGQNCLGVLEKLSSYPLSQISLIKIIENNPNMINDIVTIFKNIEISTITTILPNIPTNSMIPFFKTIKEIIKIANQCPAIWEWFKEYFSLPCNPSFLCDRNEIPQNNDFTAPFDYFIKIINQSKTYNELPWPKLPRLSVFNGKRCSLLAVKEALLQCTNQALQIRNINEIPLEYEKIQKLVSYINRPKYFGCAFQWCRDGSIILDMAKDIKNDGIRTSFNPINNLDAFTLLTIRAMMAGITISNIIVDLRKEKEITKHMIIKIALQLNQSDFEKVREWCSAALFCSEQCGSGILEKVCNLITSKKYSLSDVLQICNIISRLNNTSQIGYALSSSNPKEKIKELMRIEDNSKSFETIIKEMSTSIKTEFQPYKFAFDGTPVICLRNEDILALHSVYNSMKSAKLPSTKREIQEEISRLGKEMQIKPNEKTLGNLIAILSHSFEIIFKIRPYLIQCITVAGLVLSEIHPIPGLKGRIAQVATGEGKSIDIVLLASICAAQGRCVDIITSTHYLAQRDFQKFAPFYEFIGLSCNCIAKEPQPSIDSFNGLILYGINTDFEFTILREGINGNVIQKTQLTKGGPFTTRNQNTIITDESDNLFIDNANNSARIAWKSNENVSWVFAPLYTHLSETLNFNITDVRSFLSSYLDGKFTEQVSKWSNDKLETWISSFLLAQSKVNGRDYVIGINQRTRQKEVQIVHLGTGRIQYGSRWSNGVHEFIETREGIIPENENYTIASISHTSFFGRYEHIYGLTGTAGELIERNEVMETYHIDTFDVPPNRKCLRKRLPTEILNNNNELQNRLIQIVNETKRQNRPLLLLFLSIDDTIKFSQLLSENKIAHMVMNELQREDEDYIVFRAGQPGVVTIATNTAGRGTDIVLSPTSKANGGLRVAFTFFPENFRVECQGLGRAGRQGQPGTAEIITSLDDPYIVKLIGKINPSVQRDEAFIKNLYQKRSNQIKFQSESRMIHSTYEMKLFKILSIFFTKLKEIDERFTNDGSLHKEFTNIGFNSMILWKFIKYVLQQKWAELFSYLSQKSNIDQAIINKYYQDYENKYLSPLLSADPKNVVNEALKIYQEL